MDSTEYAHLGSGIWHPDAQLDQVRSVGHRDLLLFYGHRRTGPGVGAWVLSQWAPVPFTVSGVEYANAEVFMMAAKARLFGDVDALGTILGTTSPAAAKAAGRRVRGFDQARWDRHAYRVVVAGNLAKFSQHPSVGAFLDGTGDRVLVEASPSDRVWGIGLPAPHPDARDPHRWRGRNLLGFALREVRHRLRHR